VLRATGEAPPTHPLRGEELLFLSPPPALVANPQENTIMFVAYEVSLDTIRALSKIVPVIASRNRDLADQIERAASSVVLNLGEGARSVKGNKQKHYSIAHGSANEVRAALETAEAWGWLENASGVFPLLDRLLGLLWGLTHPR
jgi:four helix bundle protein